MSPISSETAETSDLQKVQAPSCISQLRLMILEDNELIANRIFQIIKAWRPEAEILMFHDLRTALLALENEAVDLLIVDLQLPDGTGIDAIRRLRKVIPNAQSIVVSALAERSVVFDALQAGAVGYILKDDDSVGITDGISAVLNGHSPISISIARHVIDLMNLNSPQPMTENHSTDLTRREIEVLNAIAKGFTNKEVAEIMGISVNTVPVHIRNIYKKLQASNRTEATYEAMRLGIIKR